MEGWPYMQRLCEKAWRVDVMRREHSMERGLEVGKVNWGGGHNSWEWKVELQHFDKNFVFYLVYVCIREGAKMSVLLMVSAVSSHLDFKNLHYSNKMCPWSGSPGGGQSKHSPIRIFNNIYWVSTCGMPGAVQCWEESGELKRQLLCSPGANRIVGWDRRCTNKPMNVYQMVIGALERDQVT